MCVCVCTGSHLLRSYGRQSIEYLFLVIIWQFLGVKSEGSLSKIVYQSALYIFLSVKYNNFTLDSCCSTFSPVH